MCDLKPGAARNALDCALWDLEAKRCGKRVYEMAGLGQPQPLLTAFTLSLGTPEAMAAKAVPITLSKKRPFSAQENYVMDLVWRELDQLLTDDQRQDGGMKIYTTIDPVLQKAAESAVNSELTKVEARSGYKHPKKADFSAEAKEEEQQTPYLQFESLFWIPLS